VDERDTPPEQDERDASVADEAVVVGRNGEEEARLEHERVDDSRHDPGAMTSPNPGVEKGAEREEPERHEREDEPPALGEAV